jgi:hypothetical protein
LSAGAAPTGTRGAGFALNGQRAESGSFLLDGSDNNDTYNSGPGQIVPLDVVEEYRLMTHNFTAEYGRNTGFIANVVTKSGTNDFHGAAYYFNRNSALAANTYENNARGIPRPVFNRHQLGGAVGGPILRDKLFFYAAVEPILVRSSATLSYYVPTPELLAGEFGGNKRDVSPLSCAFKSFPDGREYSHRLPVWPVLRLHDQQWLRHDSRFCVNHSHRPSGCRRGVPQDTLLWTGRLDYTLNERSTLNVRYAFQDANQFATVTQPYSAELDQPFNVRNQNITLNLTLSCRATSSQNRGLSSAGCSSRVPPRQRQSSRHSRSQAIPSAAPPARSHFRRQETPLAGHRTSISSTRAPTGFVELTI